MEISPDASYKFECVPDYMHPAPWPFVSEEGLASAATFIYYGKDSAVAIMAA